MPNVYLTNINGTITEVLATDASTGVTEAGKVVALDATGKLDLTLMPVGLGAETDTITASEALSAGDFVNIWNSTGLKVRKADASTSGKEADGFVLSAVSNGASATVYRISQSNTQLTGMTVGVRQYLSTTVPGGHQEVVPTGSGQVVQKLGIAKSATEMIFAPSDVIVKA